MALGAASRPSPRVKERGFGANASEAGRLVWHGWRQVATAFQGQAGRLPYLGFRWLAPAMAAMMLMAALVNQRNEHVLSSPTHSGPLVAIMLSNQSAAAYLPGSFQPEQNRVTSQTFEWTNGSSSTSSIRPLFVPR